MLETRSSRRPVSVRGVGTAAAVRRVSVVIPVRDGEAGIARTVRRVLAQGGDRLDVEVVVVDDGSSDRTAAVARAAGARVVRIDEDVAGNPAAARNRGFEASSGDPVVFLDDDCRPAPGWLAALVGRHDAGSIVVGGSLDLPDGLAWTARCDYYCGWYHVHSRRTAGPVPNHPPGNVSVRRGAFARTGGFEERQPIAYAHEELAWQARLRDEGVDIDFEPRATVRHHNRPGLRNLLRRNYRWGYCSIEAKARTGAARMGWLYRHPVPLVVLAGPLAVAQAVYITFCWVRARRFEPVLMLPLVLLARVSYCTGMAVGGLRWLLSGRDSAREYRPRWE